MQVYTQRSFTGHHRSAHAADLILEFLDKSGVALISLFSPEDTTGKEGKKPLQISKHSTYNIRGLIKAAFWIAISISIALWMGRLS